MRKLKRIVFVLLVIFLVIFFGINIFALTIGKALLSNSLSHIVGKDVRIGSLFIVLPYTLSINNLKISDILTIDKINIHPSIVGIFVGKLGLNKLIVYSPQFSIVRLNETKFNFSEVVDKLKPSKSKSHFFIKEAVIEDGEISFIDKLTQSSFQVTPIDISAITSLIDFKTRINLSAQAVSGSGKKLGQAKADGWLNFLKKDMQAKFSIEDLDISYFSSLFENAFTRKIKSGTLNFNADAVSKSNDLIIDCHIETRNLRFVGDEALILDTEKKEITLFDNLSGIILDSIIGPGSGGIFDFSIHTKFDHPKLEGLRFKGNIFKEPIKNIIQELPKEISKETVENIKEDFKALGKELKDQFKDIKDIFKIKKEEDQEDKSQESTPSQQIP